MVRSLKRHSLALVSLNRIVNFGEEFLGVSAGRVAFAVLGGDEIQPSSSRLGALRDTLSLHCVTSKVEHWKR